MTSEPAADPLAAEWVGQHHAAIWRYLSMLGASAEEADDLAQETMLIGCASPAPDPELARPFLRGVARNLWLRSRRWWHRKREREIAAAVDELWAASADESSGEDLLRQLRQCLELLQPRAQQALQLHYRDGLAWRDAARLLGMRPNGTKTLVQRAKQVLRTSIERRSR